MKQLIELLQNKTNVDEFRIIESKTMSKELFFIKDELQMNRGKDVYDINVTIYKNFEENEKKYKGSSNVKLAPTMTLEEMDKQIDIAALAASFVKNEYYSLEQPSKETAPVIPSAFNEGEIIDNISNLVKDLYEENNNDVAFINSTEFFINKKDIRIINSNGIDISYTKYQGEIELITEASGETEAIELYDVLHFSDYDKNAIKEAIKEALHYAELRAKAVPMPNVKDIPVLLNGVAAKGLYNCFLFHASGNAKYNKFHTKNIGDSVQANIEKDAVTITLAPYLKNSSRSSYYDVNGTYLKETKVIENGVIKAMTASKRFADYLDITPTGDLPNTIVEKGSYKEDDLKQGPYLEIIKFSAFQADELTGNFGGEFRLGIYFDGEKEIPVTLGSIAANLKEVESNMYLSQELVQENNFQGPKYIKFDNIRIAGN